MQIKDGKIKPCPTCLKARQAAKDLARRLAGNSLPPYTAYTMTSGAVLYVDSKTHVLAACTDCDLTILGRRVYVAGRQIIDVAEAEPLVGVGTVVASAPVDALPPMP